MKVVKWNGSPHLGLPQNFVALFPGIIIYFFSCTSSYIVYPAPMAFRSYLVAFKKCGTNLSGTNCIKFIRIVSSQNFGVLLHFFGKQLLAIIINIFL